MLYITHTCLVELTVYISSRSNLSMIVRMYKILQERYAVTYIQVVAIGNETISGRIIKLEYLYIEKH